MSAPQLSVILPIFNVDRWLPECLNSIQAQTFTGWEALLVDDGSTDFSGIMCDSFTRRDPRFKVIHQKNSGVSAARNAGIDAATGDLLSFVDPDDFVSLNYFQVLISEMRRIDADVAVSITCITDESGVKNLISEYLSKSDAAFILKSGFSQMQNNDTVIEGVYRVY